MKAYRTLGSKRGKGKRGFTLIELLIVMVILAILAGVVVMAVGGVFGQAKARAYDTMKPQIQNAVTAYQADTEGARPIGTNDSARIGQLAVNGHGTCDIISICQIVGDPAEDLLRTVPECIAQTPGNSSDNFDDGNCVIPATASGLGHYIWVVDVAGNVYSVCDEDLDGNLDENGATSNISEREDGYHDDVWP
jgi:prepilin-type N-terminal cleavage/methylation domain-containing protein